MKAFLKNKVYLLCILLPFQVIIFYFLSLFPNFIEKYYTSGIYKLISQSLRFITGCIPIPIGQILIAIVIILILKWIYKWTRIKEPFRIKIKSLLMNIIATISVVYFSFMMIWGLNYSRKPIAEILEYGNQILVVEDLTKVCEILIAKTNEARFLVSKQVNRPTQLKIGWNELSSQCIQGFENISTEQHEFKYDQPSIKKVIGSRCMSFLGIGGIYFPFTGEANVNGDLPSFTLPFTICHEMAHQIGFAKEDEANFVSYLVCVNHPDKEFQYSGYLTLMKYALGELRFRDYESYEKLKQNFSEGLITDLNWNREYWTQFEGPLVQLSSDVNDMYLKANNQNDGVDSYNLVVQLLIKEYRQKGWI